MGFVANGVLNLSQGAPLYLLADPAGSPLNAELLLDAAHELRPCALNTVPVIVEGLCALLRAGHPRAAALSSLRLLTYGGAALPSHCAATLRAHAIVSACTYGQTETAGPVMLGAVAGDLNALRPIGGAAYALLASDDAEGGGGELELRALECITPCPKGWRSLSEPGGAAADVRGAAARGAPYRTGDLFHEVDIGGAPWLLYAMRSDDVLAHTSGELTNPHPPEDAVRSACADEVANVVMVGSGRTRPALLVQLAPGLDLAHAAARVAEAVDVANAGLAEYSRLKLADVWLLQPPAHEPLPVSLKGNVVRPRAEARLATIERGDEAPPTLLASAPIGDLLGGETPLIDSMAMTTGAGAALEQNREAAKYGHALFLVLYQVVSIHWLIKEGGMPAEHRGPVAGQPLWLAVLLRMVGHHFAMPMGFVLVAVTDAARLPDGASAEQLREFARSQLLKPYAALVVFHLSLDACGLGHAYSVMWFFFALLVLRTARLGACAAGVSSHAAAVGGVGLYLLSGLPPLVWMRRCVGPGFVSDAADPLGGRNSADTWSCNAPFPDKPASVLFNLLVPYWFGTDQIHVRVAEHLAYYAAGPVVLAHVLRLRGFSPSAAGVPAWSPLRHPERMAALTLAAALFVVGVAAARPNAAEYFGVGGAASDTCAGLAFLEPAKRAAKLGACCETDAPLLLRHAELGIDRLMLTLVCAAGAAGLLRPGSARARLHRVRVLVLAMLPLAVRLNNFRSFPYVHGEWASSLLLDAARTLTSLGVCTAWVELLPGTPTALSRAGLLAAAPIYFLHNIPQVYNQYAQAQGLLLHLLPVLSSRWLLPYVGPALIVGCMLLAGFLWEHGRNAPSVLREALRPLPEALPRLRERAPAAVASLRERAPAAVASLREECRSEERLRARLAAAWPRVRASPAALCGAVLLASLIVHWALAPPGHIEQACGGPPLHREMPNDMPHPRGVLRHNVSLGKYLPGGAWHRAGTAAARYTCVKDRTLHLGCLPEARECPIKSVKTLRACKDVCDSTGPCRSLVHNKYGECYIHGEVQHAPARDEATHHTMLCSKSAAARLPDHAYYLRSRGERGEVRGSGLHAALLAANFSGKLEAVTAFSLLEARGKEGGGAAKEKEGGAQAFTRDALTELRRWPLCRRHLDRAARSKPPQPSCTERRPSCCLERWWGAPVPFEAPRDFLSEPAPAPSSPTPGQARCCTHRDAYADAHGATGGNESAALRSAHACSAVPGRTLSFVRLLLHVHMRHARAGAEPAGLVLLLEEDARPLPAMWSELEAFVLSHPPDSWDVARLHGGGDARPLGTAALLIDSAKVVKLLHAFSSMHISDHDLMLRAAAQQNKLRVVVSEQRLFFPPTRARPAAAKSCE